jgi:multimeric flavodoxin WrbA
MRIIVLNGSPKGEKSVTMQYVKYMQKKFANVELDIVHIAQGIRKIENDEEEFNDIIGRVKAADGVLWAFPLYILIVHANLIRFIELIEERGAQDAFAGKYAAALSTSINFFDHTAHNYIRAVCDDLRMKYTGFFSAEMEDLFKADQREKLERFTNSFLRHIEKGLPSQRVFAPVREESFEYRPGPESHAADAASLKVLLITDGCETGNLPRMTERLKRAFTSPVEIVNLKTANIKGGCLGCIQCGFDNQCAYGDSDDVKEIYDVKIKNADIVIFAARLAGRYFSARFKTFIDRRFLHTHMPQMVGKQIAYVISGPLSQNANVLEMMQGITELDQANLAGVVTDECDDSAALDALLDSLALELVECARAHYVRPRTFLGVGGQKIFRDDIYGQLRFVFQADHRYYKTHGFYDFPQKNLKTRLTNLIMIPLTKIPAMKKQIRSDLTSHMIEPYKKTNG